MQPLDSLPFIVELWLVLDPQVFEERIRSPGQVVEYDINPDTSLTGMSKLPRYGRAKTHEVIAGHSYPTPIK